MVLLKAKEEKTYESHPLSYERLETAQQADKHLLKILNMGKLEVAPYPIFSWGRNKEKANLLHERR